MDRTYYSQRIGRGPLANPTVEDISRALTLTVDEMWRRDYMQEWHGYECVDAGTVGGRAAMPPADHIEAETGWRSAWPLPETLIDLPDDVHVSDADRNRLLQQAEDKLFDLIEYFHRHVSQGIDEDGRHFHGHGGCGWHYQGFDPAPAQALLRQRMNRVLVNYRSGFQISESGQIEHSAHDGLDQLIGAPLRAEEADITERVAGAIALYRSRGRTEQDLRLAVRELFDVLEKLRPVVKAEMLRRDEADLFNIANNFTIRHLNEKQKGNYDSALWHSWMFYVNLSTIHLITRIMKRNARKQHQAAGVGSNAQLKAGHLRG
jgi:hypothetical protein